MKKVALMGLLLCGHGMDAGESDGAPAYNSLMQLLTTRCYKHDAFGDAYLTLPLISIVIGKSLDAKRVESTIIAIGKRLETSGDVYPYILWAQNDQPTSRPAHASSKFIPVREYDVKPKQFTTVNDYSSSLQYKDTISNADKKCHLAVFCVNKKSLSLDIDKQLLMMRWLISQAQDVVAAERPRLCLLIDEDGLDQQAYPLLNEIDNSLYPKELEGWLAASYAPYDDEAVFKRLVFRGPNDSKDEIIQGDGYFKILLNKCTPWNVRLKNALFSKLFGGSCIMICAIIYFYLKK